MARMIGKLLVRDWCGYGCCTSEKSKHTVKREEMAQALKEADEELAHPPGLCFNPYTGMAGCEECEYTPSDDYDHYDNAELENNNINGVWCNSDWRELWDVP